jgi:hypothetical protein
MMVYIDMRANKCKGAKLAGPDDVEEKCWRRKKWARMVARKLRSGRVHAPDGPTVP